MPAYVTRHMCWSGREWRNDPNIQMQWRHTFVCLCTERNIPGVVEEGVLEGLCCLSPCVPATCLTILTYILVSYAMPSPYLLYTCSYGLALETLLCLSLCCFLLSPLPLTCVFCVYSFAACMPSLPAPTHTTLHTLPCLPTTFPPCPYTPATYHLFFHTATTLPTTALLLRTWT